MSLKNCIERWANRLEPLSPADRAKKIANDLPSVMDWPHVWKLLGCADPVGPGLSSPADLPSNFPDRNASQEELSSCKERVLQLINDSALPANTVGLKIVRDSFKKI